MEKKQIWTVVGIALVVLIVGFVYTNMTGEIVGEGRVKAYDREAQDVLVGGKAYTIYTEVDYDLKIVDFKLTKLGESIGEAQGVIKGEVSKFYFADKEVHVVVLNIMKAGNNQPYAVLQVSEVS